MPRSFAFTFMSPLRNLGSNCPSTPPDTDRCPATLYLDGSRLAAPYHETTNLANRSNLLPLLFLFPPPPIPRLSNLPSSRISLPRFVSQDYRGESKRIIKRFQAEKEFSLRLLEETTDGEACREDRVANVREALVNIQLEIAAG